MRHLASFDFNLTNLAHGKLFFKWVSFSVIQHHLSSI
jgi:hypothetical protein